MFNVVSIVSLAGAASAIEGHELAAVVIVLSGPDVATRPLVSALRRHTALEHVAVFVIADSAPLVAADLCGLVDVHVIPPSSAQYDLALRIGATPRMSSRPAPRRPSHVGLRQTPPISEPPAFINRTHHEQLERFCKESSGQAEHALLLCERLAQRETQSAERVRATDELSHILSATRASAAAVQLTELESVLTLAEHVLGHTTSRGNLLVPRGVVGLLSAVRDLTAGVAALSRLDVELQRARLLSALDR